MKTLMAILLAVAIVLIVPFETILVTMFGLFLLLAITFTIYMTMDIIHSQYKN